MKIPDPEHALDYFITVLKHLVSKSKKSKKKYKNNKFKKRQPWITDAIIQSSITKNNLHTKSLKNPKNLSLKNEYKEYLKIYKKVISVAKSNYEKEQVKKRLNNSRKLWQYINSKINNKVKNNSQMNYLINEKNQKIYHKLEIANEFNSFYENVGNNLAKKIKKETINYNIIKKCDYTFYLYPTSTVEIIRVIKNMADKTGGVDNINKKVLVTLSSYIVMPLEHIFNLCFIYDKWPTGLKTANIIPIYKSGDKQFTTNYRPISLISNLAKVLEKLLHFRILRFIKKNNILFDNQFGFRKNIGTKEALAHITNILYSHVNMSLPTVVTYLDLGKAFDTVQYNILYKKLSIYGFRGKILNLIKSYLTGRKQSVIVNNVRSAYTTVSVGLPQGTILGPLLFILYINDIFNILPKDVIISYADDTAVVSSDRT